MVKPAALKREIKKLKAEWDILKKLREVFDVSPSGFYSWLGRPRSRRPREDKVLVRQIRRSFSGCDRACGVRRV